MKEKTIKTKAFNNKNEKLYRAVRPWNAFWKKDGTLSSAAFKDKNGLSVERGDDDSEDYMLHYVLNFGFEGKVVSVTVEECKNVEAVVKHRPSERSLKHSEIHKSEKELLLTNRQAKELAKCAKIIEQNRL